MRGGRPAPFLEPPDLIGRYDPTPISEIIRRRRLRALGPRLKVAVFPGFFNVGGLPPAAALASWAEEVVGIWNGGAQGATRFSSEVAGPTQITSTPGSCNQGWANIAATAHPEVSGDKSIFMQEYDPACRYGGEAVKGGCCSFVNNTGSTYTGAHELGHSLGEDHDRWGQPSPGCEVGNYACYQTFEYGAKRSVMAGGDKVIWRHRLDQGWLTPVQAGRVSGRFHLDDIEQSQSALIVTREDGQTLALERRVTGVDVFSSYFGSVQVADALQPGAVYAEIPGGVRLRVEADGWIDYTAFAPPPPPTPDPAVTPTAVPTFGTGTDVTPFPTPCFVGGIVRCTPSPGPATPTATPTPWPSSTETPAPTSTPAEVQPPEPTMTPADIPVTPEISSTPTPVPPVPTLTPTHRPTSTKHGGCASIFGAIVFPLGFLLFFRRSRRGF